MQLLTVVVEVDESRCLELSPFVKSSTGSRSKGKSVAIFVSSFCFYSVVIQTSRNVPRLLINAGWYYYARERTTG